MQDSDIELIKLPSKLHKKSNLSMHVKIHVQAPSKHCCVCLIKDSLRLQHLQIKNQKHQDS